MADEDVEFYEMILFVSNFVFRRNDFPKYVRGPYLNCDKKTYLRLLINSCSRSQLGKIAYVRLVDWKAL